jgi:hypothetical protein
MAGGLVASMIAFAAGAILNFAVTAEAGQPGLNLHNLGVVLTTVGAIGVVYSLVALFAGGGPRRHRAALDDGRGNVQPKEDCF